MELRLPSNSRAFVCGTTGSGKTTFAAYLLSRSILSKPWIIIDYKREEIFDKLIDRGIPLQTANFHRPKRGLAIIRPRPQVDNEAVEELLWEMWRKGNSGVFIDEALHLPPRSAAMTNILAQGRSKRIQVIVCSQRPFYISPFLISEAGYFAVFELTDKRDKDRIVEFVPLSRNYEDPPQHYCYWYEKAEKRILRLAPLPRRMIEYVDADIVDRLPVRIW